MPEQNQTESIQKAVQDRVKAESERLQQNETVGTPEVTNKFIHDCLQSNELGDGILFNAVNLGQFIYNTSTGQWYSWNGVYFEPDQAGAPVAAVEAVVKAYGSYFSLFLKQKTDASLPKEERVRLEAKIEKLHRRINRLRSKRGAENTLFWARTTSGNSISVSATSLDCHPWLLACQNCVLDLRTGNNRPGRQEDLLTMASPVTWQGIDHPAPLWESTLHEIFAGDQELIAYLQRLLGYGVTGLSTEHVLPILYGSGRNGKTIIAELLSHVLGPLGRPVQSELLLDQGRFRRSAASPSPDIMALRGLRTAFASESDEGRRISPSRVKWLTGGDTLVGRNPHDKFEIEFRPSHTLLLLTNDRPQAPPDDFGFWERIHLIPFRAAFVNREPQAENEFPADKKLPDKLKVEAAGILAWLVRGCLAWQEQGLDPPPVVLTATKEYQRDEDLLADFIDETCFLDPYAEIGASRLYDAFLEWFERNISKRGLSQKKFGRMMVKRFKKEKLGGRYVYYGVGLLSDEPSGS